MNKVKQISIFLENKAGRLAKVTETLADSGINIHALSLADTSDFGILRLIVNNNEKAKQALRDAGFTVGSTEVIAVEMPHSPGGLNRILQLFSENDLNIEYMYAFVHKNQHAILVFRSQELDRSVEMLERNGITVLAESSVYDL